MLPAGEGFRHRGHLRAQSFVGDGGDLHAEDTSVAIGSFGICQNLANVGHVNTCICLHMSSFSKMQGRTYDLFSPGADLAGRH